MIHLPEEEETLMNVTNQFGFFMTKSLVEKFNQDKEMILLDWEQCDINLNIPIVRFSSFGDETTIVQMGFNEKIQIQCNIEIFRNAYYAHLQAISDMQAQRSSNIAVPGSLKLTR